MAKYYSTIVFALLLLTLSACSNNISVVTEPTQVAVVATLEPTATQATETATLEPTQPAARLKESATLAPTQTAMPVTETATLEPTQPEARVVEWPTEGWSTDSPAHHGLDEAQVEAVHQKILAEYPHVRSLLIVRHGKLVVENYYQQYGKDTLFELASVTKSVTSILIGIALKTGQLQSVQQPLSDFLPETMLSEYSKNLTLYHLLTMSSGLEEQSYGYYNSDPANDQIVTTLHIEPSTEPGTTFFYNTPAVHVLSAVLMEVTDMPPREFAGEHLFGPLGITAYRWQTDAQGRHFGGHGLSLRAQDMAKLGYLYLHQGRWADTQIVDPEWVTESVQAHIPTDVDDIDYGYLWWLPQDTEGFLATGYGGQYIYVDPTLNLIIVMTSDLDRHHDEHLELLRNEVLATVIE